MSSLPMYFPSQFNLQTALYCATLTSYAYDMYDQWIAQGKPRKESGFAWKLPEGTGLTFSSPIWSGIKWLHFFNESEPFGFLATDGQGNGYLVFRGTESDMDWVDDIEVSQTNYDLAPNYGPVHDGFYKLYVSMRNDVLGAFSQLSGINNLMVTGHSLGCGLSTLAVPDVMTQQKLNSVQHYNLASPRVGSPAFTDAYNANGVLTFRIVNTCDIVPEVPPAVLDKDLYKHIGTPVDYTAQYGSLAGNHSLATSYTYALENPNSPENSGSN